MLLEGKSAIVTGGSQGIGAAISLELAREGADICLTYRKHEAEAKNYAAEIEAMGRKALALQCDISVYAEAETTVNTALKAFGRIDILVNNAGMNWDGVSWKMSEEQWDGPTGMVTDAVVEDFRSCKGMSAYLCGPPAMIEAGVRALKRRRMAPRLIFREEFTVAPPVATTAAS